MWNNQGKEPQMWSTHDLACAHCRARKIRCGRERPQCESCKRDGVECRYSSPGKRVNHVKLLCQNFETLEGQLHSIQNDLSDLTSLVKGGSSVRSLSLPAEEWIPENHSGTDSTSTPHINRHIVRNTSQSLDRYHGPCSLYALCKEFSDDPSFCVSENNGSGQNAVSEHMMQEMLNEASSEPHLDMLSHPVGICLPPRQFLNLVIGPFFKNVDYATDVFVRSNFQPHVDRIYSQPIGPADEGWAVCFNVIVLLGIKKEPTIQGNSHFVQTLLQTLKMAVNNPRVFLTPRLVNVQALALLSYVAEQYSTTSLAELVFAQACLLARTMGLHQINASSDDLPPEDILERHKVFRSLYIRDKNIAIFRGSTAWLPGYDSGIPPSFDEAETGTPDLLARLELAKLQDEVYQAFHAAGAPNLHPSRHYQVLAQLQQRLEQWSSTHSIMQKALTSTETFSLMLSFFATRICLSKDNDDMRSTQPFKDAKACCLVFLLATAAKPDLRLSEALKEVLGQHKSLDQPSPRKTKRSSRTQPAVTESDDSATSALPRLAATFPLAAAFIVAKDTLLQPIGEVDGTPSRPEEEITILEALRDRFAKAAEQAHIDNLALSFSRILGLLVRVVRQKRSPEANSTPSLACNELSSLHSTRSSSSLQESVVSSFRDTPPGPENFSTVSSISEAVSNSSLLLPFTQPLEDSASGSPWFANVGQSIGLNSTPVSMSWPVQHKRQSEEAEHLTKRPRMSCQEEYLDIPAVYLDHGSRTEDDSLFTFDFLNTGADISVFDMED
ncbi:hypothetical protein FOXG_19815 [Fusarium oxysporum f. sp. lycopersici 4287]|uniref:Zn(2)-C6 fungal-type domain-containing protein n=2 Tax=Fusarium oxysporum TaxID=5507 RepID=A0A0J9V8J1_FUSO4|nr:hypothetical protein FOXG_19815 [Fusarium oxysporum f. sp. lycopersici 4287]EXK32081.1 hypothetical protein FOMG_12406 [Fusarium oxysporum f. sp. melonis 26406]KAJ9423937.1 hypothetical protein QL093DRAFT_1311658 [Fusarium oxysporum]KNB07211.1 hypothetical protein FOXG_19815 [Fusarium oxysporum f. sp. lycopersici 4287]